MDLELVPTAMAAGGDAIARDRDGRVVFVEGGLPGEGVRARVVHAKKDFARATVLDVVGPPSPDRVGPPCAALAAGCGGCSWQHIEATAQRRLKVSIVEDALRRIGRFRDETMPAITMRPLVHRAVRTTARLGVAADGRAGQHRRHGHEVIPTASCVAAHPMLGELIVDGRFAGADEVLLRVGVASGERAVAGFPHASPSTFVVPPDVAIGDDAVVHESIAGAWLQVSMGSFFQSGPVAAEALVAAVTDAVGDALPAGGHLVDAYAGVGLFGATVGAGRHARVTSIESDPSANDDARVNLAELDAVVIEGEVGRWRPAAVDRPVDVVVADPARTGLGRPGSATVVATGAPRVVLVSCDPASLARDARLLEDAGYALASVSLVDAFPDTFHVEAVSRFDRRASGV
ncbi:MAG TPA: TRAM domain-containing protein [Acidimicrobiales bacterium]|nr:TRAM domain-containing protein [Acidimicrobiales bacterium]